MVLNAVYHLRKVKSGLIKLTHMDGFNGIIYIIWEEELKADQKMERDCRKI